MKTLYIDCQMGAAGDMLTGALLELVSDKKGMIDQMNAIGIPGVIFSAEKSVKCGVVGTHINVSYNGVSEGEEDYAHSHMESSHEHAHNEDGHLHNLMDGPHAPMHEEANHMHSHIDGKHEHVHESEDEHHHSHASLHNIEHIVREHMILPKKVADDVMAVYNLIAQAESSVHGVSVTDIHFHEVGTMDAIADITAVCLLMYLIAPERVVVSPVNVGSGKVKCAHGILPVPAPATAYILRNTPTYSNSISGELCTPTGAALLKYFATEFGNLPAMTTTTIGYGMGRKDFEAANCVRIMLGESFETTKISEYDKTYDINEKNSGLNDKVTMLSCNIDDMTGEELGFAMDILLNEGALEAYTVPIGMKKSRPGTMLNVLVKNSAVDEMVKLIFKHTTTIGIRKSMFERYTLDREMHTINTRFGNVREKYVSGYGINRSKLEYDDIANIAKENGMSLNTVVNIIRSDAK